MDDQADVNAWSAYHYALGRDTPGKVWWNCPPLHAATFRALQIDRGDEAAIYACAPFRIHKAEDGVRIIAAYPAPALFGTPDHHWLGIETVISWDPLTDAAAVLGDEHPQIIGHLTDEANHLFSSPKAFFQHWAMNRARFAVKRREAVRGSWKAIPKERDEVPGGLVIGATNDIRWQPSALPETIRCVGINPQVVNKAIMRAARLPRALGGA